MGGQFFYLTHPQVRIDPAVPVPDWGLSDTGLSRARRAAGAALFANLALVCSSAERKALETAEAIARPRNLPVSVLPRTHENDRSATGFLRPEEFESVVNDFFAEPHTSVRGWERAIDAQARIVSEAAPLLDASRAGDVLMVGHGGVGTLLLCHLAGLEISRDHDQPAGGGNLFAYNPASQEVTCRWTPVEALDTLVG
jgi:broad specificity phosphatase PhoE